MFHPYSSCPKSKKQILLSAVICAILISQPGCATVKEGAKCFIGISTKVLEENRKDAIKKTFNYDYNACFDKAREVLLVEQAYIYVQDKKNHMIAIYLSDQDTTPVGVFFKEIDAKITQIELSSPSKYAKESIAQKLFYALDDLLNPQRKEVYPHAKEQMQN